MISTTKV